MDKIHKGITALAKWFNYGASICIVVIMTLVVLNVLLRAVFTRPILGAYEYSGFLTAVAIGLALAYCAVQNGHIAIGIVVDRMSSAVQRVIGIIRGIFSFVLLLLISWQLFIHAGNLSASGEVSATTKTPFYPFVAIVASGVFLLALVIVSQIFRPQGEGEDK